MATDPWYVRELVADIPPDEWEAAVECEDWDDDEQGGEDGDEAEEEEEESADDDYSEESESDDDGTDSGIEGSRESVHSDDDLETSGVLASDSGSSHSPRSPETSPTATP